MGPTYMSIKHDVYFINGFRFNTKTRDDTRVHQNSGVYIVAKTMQFSSAKDTNPIFVEMKFYGVIQEIWELDYRAFRIPVFKCKWVESNNSIREDIYAGLTLVDLNKEGHKDDIFIMAMQAKQVFYISIDSQWSVALFTQPRNHDNDDDYDGDNDSIAEHNMFERELEDLNNLETTTGSYFRKDGDDAWIEQRCRNRSISYDLV